MAEGVTTAGILEESGMSLLPSGVSPEYFQELSDVAAERIFAGAEHEQLLILPNGDIGGGARHRAGTLLGMLG